MFEPFARMLSALVVGIFFAGACGAAAKQPTISDPSKEAELSDTQHENQEAHYVHDHTAFVEGEAAVLAVADARRLLVEGEYDEVLYILTNHNYLGERQLLTEQTVIEAVAWIRIPASKLEGRLAFLSRRVSYLEFAVKAEPNNARYIARLAEGYANYPKRKAEARVLLEDLEKSGLIPDAFAYATLAQLRAEFGEQSAAKEALARCKELDARKHLCSLTPQHMMPHRALADQP